MVMKRLAPAPPNWMFACGRRFVSEETAPNVSAPAAVSTSPTVKKTVFAVSSGVCTSAIAPSTGASFTGWTVTVNELLADRLLSSRTSSVMRAEPNAFVDGRICTVRLTPTPPRRMPLRGISAGFEENRTTVNAPAGVS